MITMPVDYLVFAKCSAFSALRDTSQEKMFECVYKLMLYVQCLYIARVVCNEFQVTTKPVIKVHFLSGNYEFLEAFGKCLLYGFFF